MRDPFKMLTPWQWACAGLAAEVFAEAVITKAQETPYFHITEPKTGEVYMERWWLFNGFPPMTDGGKGEAKYPELPSVRVHHIVRPDSDRHLHNHPWNAVSIILKGQYTELRENGKHYTRRAGDVVSLNADTYHSITKVSEGGVWTLFITGEWQHTWGFQVNGQMIPWREYLGIPEGEG